MAARVNSLPEDFVPFGELNVCSNLMKRGKAPFVVGETIPLLVGKGNTHPRIWLSAPVDPKGNEWIDLIMAGKSMRPEVQLFTSESQEGVLSVQVFRQPVLEVRLASPDSAEVPFINLRPIGLNIFGENGVLNLGPNTLSNNSFDNVAFMAKLW